MWHRMIYEWQLRYTLSSPLPPSKSLLQLAALYDHRSGLFCDAPESERECDIRVGVDLVGSSPNPIIKLARSRIVDELSPEEEELMGE